MVLAFMNSEDKNKQEISLSNMGDHVIDINDHAEQLGEKLLSTAE